MAIGIVCFVIISLIGLVSISIQTGRRASDDTQVAMLAKVAMADFLTVPFANLQGQTVYFDVEGAKLSGRDNAYYECLVSVRDEADDLKSVSMQFRWPAAATNQQAANEQIFLTSVANY